MINLYINHNIYKHAITQTIKQVKKSMSNYSASSEVETLSKGQKMSEAR